MNLPGYLSPEYGNSFREVGEIIKLPNSQIQLIKRYITGDLFDLIGVYPYTMCNDWSKLLADVKFLGESGAVSIVFITDPFYENEVQSVVSDWYLYQPFKTHLVVDLQKDWRSDRSKDLRRLTRRALEKQDVEVVKSDRHFAPAFWNLYKNSLIRHNISGIARLSQSIIADHLEIDGAFLLIARIKDAMMGAILIFNHGETSNLHLIFPSTEAYTTLTNHALYYSSMAELEKRGCRYLNLGGAAGLQDNPTDGLFQFKRRWANCRRTTMLCGEILNSEVYNYLCASTGNPTTNFFPAYRYPGGPFEWLRGFDIGSDGQK